MNEIELEWTPDCCGKQDYDGNILTVSSRYWPRGGGFMVFAGGVEQPTNEAIRPSAVSSILLGSEELVRSPDFDGETEAEVKAQVERWVAEQLRHILPKIREALK